MSIQREIGHTIDDARNFQNLINRQGRNFRICLDIDHGDLASLDPKDTNPLDWIEYFGPEIGMLHLKQTTVDRRKNMPFTKENNEKGTIDARAVLDQLASAKVPSCTMYLELGFRERNPDDQIVINATRESVKYWVNSGAAV